jgi:hypothetical protein
MLSDPIVKAVMEADGVDPHELAAMLASTVARLERNAVRATVTALRFASGGLRDRGVSGCG